MTYFNFIFPQRRKCYSSIEFLIALIALNKLQIPISKSKQLKFKVSDLDIFNYLEQLDIRLIISLLLLISRLFMPDLTLVVYKNFMIID